MATARDCDQIQVPAPVRFRVGAAMMAAQRRLLEARIVGLRCNVRMASTKRSEWLSNAGLRRLARLIGNAAARADARGEPRAAAQLAGA